MLPKPIFAISYIKQPSTRKIVDGKEVFKELKFRPYVVKEEKILMIAKESGEIRDIFNAVKQIVEACCEETNFNVDNIPSFDLEYIFLQLRAISVADIEPIIITENEVNEFTSNINFKDINVVFPNDSNNIITINSTTSLIMKYPTAELYKQSNEELLTKLRNKDFFDLVLSCIDSVYQGDVLVPMTPEEMKEFLDTLGIPVYKKMKDFLINMPRLEYKFVYRTTETGEERSIKFSSLMDFFQFL